MPIKSSKQYNFMQMAAHKKGMGGISKEDAKKFIKETPKKKRGMFAKGKD